MSCKPPLMDILHADHDAVLFDLDGVITGTAALHAFAWKRLFDDFLGKREADRSRAVEPFDEDAEYAELLDGKPRLDGVRSFLDARGIRLPEGDPADPPEADTVHGLGKRKNRIFHEIIETRGVRTHPFAVPLLRLLEEKGFSTAAVTASRNGEAVLRAAGVEDRFDVLVDGVAAERLGLAGKPAPDIFLEAARRVGAPPGRAVVVEDAIAGVQAGRSGGFAVVVGVDRAGRGEALLDHGADVAVKGLFELAVEGQRPAATRRVENLPSALSRLEEFRERLAERRPFVALDYDGTLTPIVERPELATLSDDMRRAVKALSDRYPVAVISGRDRPDVESLLGLDGVYVAGSHGFDIGGPAGRRLSLRRGDEHLPALDRAEASLRPQVEAIPGARIERKAYSIAVHHRGLDEARAKRVAEAVDRVLADHEGLRKRAGKKIFELQPDIDWHKGRALCWLMEALDLDGPDVLPLYLGDDATDEDAFRALQPDGVGVLVKGGGETPGRSAASHALEDCGQVRRFLETLAGSMQGGDA